jgi:hypothetical protein
MLSAIRTIVSAAGPGMRPFSSLLMYEKSTPTNSASRLWLIPADPPLLPQYFAECSGHVDILLNVEWLVNSTYFFWEANRRFAVGKGRPKFGKGRIWQGGESRRWAGKRGTFLPMG